MRAAQRRLRAPARSRPGPAARRNSARASLCRRRGVPVWVAQETGWRTASSAPNRRAEVAPWRFSAEVSAARRAWAGGPRRRRCPNSANAARADLKLGIKAPTTRAGSGVGTLGECRPASCSSDASRSELPGARARPRGPSIRSSPASSGRSLRSLRVEHVQLAGCAFSMALFQRLLRPRVSDPGAKSMRIDGAGAPPRPGAAVPRGDCCAQPAPFFRGPRGRTATTPSSAWGRVARAARVLATAASASAS